MNKKITIIWGTDKEETKTYTFKTEDQLKYFMMGVDEANGWLEYEIDEQATRITKFKNINQPLALARGQWL